jgi:hypothetical protein
MTTIEQTQTEDGDAPVQIRGNTYPIRDQLKLLGGRWNADDKVWEVPASASANALALVKAQPPKQTLPDVKDWVPVKGDTYAAKDVLKAQFNARWDGANKAWLVAQDKLAAAQAVVNALKGTGPATKRCWECGCEFTFAQAKRNDGDWKDGYCGC